MLILTRRPGEIIRIGNDIFITVLKANPHQVSLGIKAPRDVIVLRQELDEKNRSKYGIQ